MSEYCFPSARRFIEVWQSAGTFREVVEKLKMTRTAVRTRAARYRKRGVALKPLGADTWEDLREYAEKCLR
jgi:alkanesulfonate monooxygenase SsuD/methylene tetrahydromethanopterin reductase-like flavin-dependent oxidoreductase (luciferase family)